MRNTFAEVDLQAVKRNFKRLAALAPQSDALAVVKADAYGNGAIPVAKTLEKYTSMFGVAIVEEAIELRSAGINKPILVLEGPLEASQLLDTKRLDIHWMLHNRIQLDWFRKENNNNALNGHQWIKFDTGMHRLGFLSEDFLWLKNHYADVFTDQAVIATHLACADEEASSNAKTQIRDFLALVEDVKNPTSIANSAGTMAFSSSRASINRLGIAMYGSSPFGHALNNQTTALEPVMRFCAPVIAIRDIPAGDSVGYGATWTASRPSRIATVAAGYADGYPRHAKSGTPAWLNGKQINLAGRVSMDMITFDITEHDSVKIGDLVELWGPNNAINEVAHHADTIGYELMTRLSKRVPRRYI